MNFKNPKYGRILCILLLVLLISELIVEIQSESVKISDNNAIINSMNRNCHQYFKILYGVISEKKLDWNKLSKMSEWRSFIADTTRVFNVCNRSDFYFQRWLLREG